jgi:lipopolysaccharide biosynthesis glycosyltransferase
MIDRCACFITDAGYLFPTVLAAIQARKFLDREIADVVIILFVSPPEKAELIAKICERNQIILICAGNEILQGYNAMYARLFLTELLPAEYKRVLYMDGDIQITGSLNDLIQTELPGKSDFAAVPDPMAIELYAAKSGDPKIQSYFEGIGVNSSPARPYFNSGVLLINLSQWAAIGRDALDVLTNAPEKCLFQDQSALNFAGHSKFAPMSFRWNFPIFFRNCGVEAPLAPRVYHFMSKPKPWNGAFPPWNRKFVEPYTKLISEYPELKAHSKKLPLSAHIKYLGQQYSKRANETITWRFSTRRRAILEFDAATRF